MEIFDETTSGETDLFDELDSTDTEELAPQYEDTEEEYTDEDDSSEEGEDLFDGETEEDDEDGEYDERFSVIDYLNESGYIDVGEDEDYSQYTGDDLNVYIENKLDAAINTRMSEALNQLPPVVRQLNEYVLAGGDAVEFFSQISNQNQFGISEKTDIENPVSQEMVVRNALQAQGYPEEYIKSQIEFLQSSGHLSAHAKTYFNNFLANKQAQMEQMIERRRQEEYMYAQQQHQNQVKLQQYIDSVDDVAGLPLSLRDKQDLVSYMVAPSYELEDGSRISGLQKDLYFELMYNPITAMQVALMLKNRNEDGTIDLSGLERSASTKLARKVRTSLRRTERSTPHGGGDKYPSYKTKGLADLLN